MSNKMKSVISNPDKYLMDSGLKPITKGHISEEARRRAKKKRRKKK